MRNLGSPTVYCDIKSQFLASRETPDDRKKVSDIATPRGRRKNPRYHACRGNLDGELYALLIGKRDLYLGFPRGA